MKSLIRLWIQKFKGFNEEENWKGQNYLKTGVGKAWAGQSKLSDWPDSRRNIVPSPVFTLGLTDPIGSEY